MGLDQYLGIIIPAHEITTLKEGEYISPELLDNVFGLCGLYDDAILSHVNPDYMIRLKTIVNGNRLNTGYALKTVCLEQYRKNWMLSRFFSSHLNMENCIPDEITRDMLEELVERAISTVMSSSSDSLCIDDYYEDYGYSSNDIIDEELEQRIANDIITDANDIIRTIRELLKTNDEDAIFYYKEWY